jgi:hypothetical protein
MVAARLGVALITMIIALLVGLSGYLGTRWHAAAVENSDLRKSVAILKRRLGSQ